MEIFITKLNGAPDVVTVQISASLGMFKFYS